MSFVALTTPMPRTAVEHRSGSRLAIENDRMPAPVPRASREARVRSTEATVLILTPSGRWRRLRAAEVDRCEVDPCPGRPSRLPLKAGAQPEPWGGQPGAFAFGTAPAAGAAAGRRCSGPMPRGSGTLRLTLLTRLPITVAAADRAPPAGR